MPARLEYHEYANLFPLIEGEEFRQLCEDIRTQGCLETIVLHEGKILDGRNRYRACLAEGVEFRTHDWCGQGKTPLAFVISKNLHRRQLTASQRAAASAEAGALSERFAREAEERRLQGNAKGGRRKSVEKVPPTSVGADASLSRKARDDAAAAFGVNPRYVQDAKKVKEAVDAGVVPVETWSELKEGKRSLKSAVEDVKKAKAPAPAPAPVAVAERPNGADAQARKAVRRALAGVISVLAEHEETKDTDLRTFLESITPTVNELHKRAAQILFRS